MSAADPGAPGAPGPVVRVLIADDDALVRAGLQLMLGGQPDLEVVGEARDGVEAVEAARRLRVDVVLMDIRMPRRDGLAATELLVASPHPPAVLVLTTFDTDESVLRALGIGAKGFLLKDTPPERIVDAVRRVAAGEPMLSPGVTTRLIAAVAGSRADDRGPAARQRLATLTEREREVALAIGAGRSNAEIGAELYLGVATVKAHVTRVIAKLGVENRVQVAICVHDAGAA